MFNTCSCENIIFQRSVNVVRYRFDVINPVKKKNNLSCVYTFSVPHSKHSPSRLQKQSQSAVQGKNFGFF
jgi:hypothetical protein